MNKSVDAFGIKVGNIVDVEESSNLGIVVPGLQEVETGFGIEVIASVPERVQLRNIVRANVGNDGQAVAPSVVFVFYHSRPGAVNKPRQTVKSDGFGKVFLKRPRTFIRIGSRSRTKKLRTRFRVRRNRNIVFY